jgi:quercetin dioxygenase-like cupin family protein
MPIIDHSKKQLGQPNEGRVSKRLVTKDDGATGLTISELTMQSGSKVRLHIHPTDEAIMLLEGNVEFVCGDERKKVGPGNTLLAPPGVKHGIVNDSGKPAKLLTIYPTTNPTATMLE